MKEATGELNVTVIAVVAIAAIATLFMVVIYPRIRNNLTNSVDDTATWTVDSSGNPVQQ